MEQDALKLTLIVLILKEQQRHVQVLRQIMVHNYVEIAYQQQLLIHVRIEIVNKIQ